MTVTRFAPSPTGYIHVGNLRTALMNFLIARKSGGTFILRLDDTDRERSKQEYVDGIKQDLDWLGLTWDRVERQSDRLDRYAAAADDLRAAGRLYEVFETPTELDLKRKKQLNMGRPPVYDRAGLRLSAEEKAKLRDEGREGYWRFLLELERIEWADGILGDDLDRRRQRLGPGADPRRRPGALHLRVVGRRHRHGGHRHRPRRRPCHQHRDPDPDHPRAGRHGAALRPPQPADRAAGRGAVEAARHAVAARPARPRGRSRWRCSA